MHNMDWNIDAAAAGSVCIDASAAERAAFEQHYGTDDERMLPHTALLCVLFGVLCLVAFLPITISAIIALGTRIILEWIGALLLPRSSGWGGK